MYMYMYMYMRHVIICVLASICTCTCTSKQMGVACKECVLNLDSNGGYNNIYVHVWDVWEHLSGVQSVVGSNPTWGNSFSFLHLSFFFLSLFLSFHLKCYYVHVHYIFTPLERDHPMANKKTSCLLLYHYRLHCIKLTEHRVLKCPTFHLKLLSYCMGTP